jgi:chromosome segregation ATPase
MAQSVALPIYSVCVGQPPYRIEKEAGRYCVVKLQIPEDFFYRAGYMQLTRRIQGLMKKLSPEAEACQVQLKGFEAELRQIEAEVKRELEAAPAPAAAAAAAAAAPGAQEDLATKSLKDRCAALEAANTELQHRNEVLEQSDARMRQEIARLAQFHLGIPALLERLQNQIVQSGQQVAALQGLIQPPKQQ